MSREEKPDQLEKRILVCVADRAESEQVVSLLERYGFVAKACAGLSSFCEEMESGAGAAYLSDDVLQGEALSKLMRKVVQQPPWSDLPLIMATGGDTLPACLKAFESTRSGGNIMLIDRPIQEAKLIHAVRIALQARRRQYDVRDLLEQREAILAGVQDPFVLLDNNFRFIYANEKALEVRRHPLEELLGRVKWEVFPELVGSPYYQAVVEAAEKKEMRRVEYRDPVSGRWYECRIYPSRAGLSMIASDITERRDAEEALRRSEERFRLIVESAVEYAIFSMDRDLRITSWNAGAERLLGYSEDEILGKPLAIIYTDEDREKDLPGREAGRARTEGQGDDERWHLRKDGSKFWASGQVSPMMDENGEVIGYVKILRDYTGRKRAETWLRALNETLEKRVEERTAEAEHRATQLQMLAGQLTEVEEHERRRLAEMLHDHLQQILVAAKMQVGMLAQNRNEGQLAEGLQRVDSLLERSIEASRSLTVELSPPILYDAGLGPALLWLARRMFENHGLEVSVEGEEDSGPELENLRAFLFQAVRELLFNIVKHAGVNQAYVKLARINGDTEVCVRDEGVGFDHNPSHAFQSKDAGFGLFSIAERVGLLGGSMKIEAAPGKGTNVCVRVRHHAPSLTARERGIRKPDRTETRLVEESLAAASGETGRIRILLADDHKILREGLAGLLREQMDFDVVSEASDGQMAVELARETNPDVVIMDVSMPRLNGVEATRIITAEMPRVRVIGLSMHAQEDMADAMRKAGAVGYVTKGAPSEILTAAIRDAAVVRPRPAHARSGSYGQH